MKKISIIIPVHNEEKNIINFTETFYETTKDLLDKYEFRLVFCDDGSDDFTWDEIKSTKEKFDKYFHISGVKLLENYGKDYAILHGIKLSKTADAIITIDGDLQHPINLIPKMIENWDNGNYLIVHFLRENKNYSKFRIFLSYLFNKFFNFITKFNLQVGITDFKIVDKKIFKKFINSKKQIFFYRGEISKFIERNEFITADVNKRVLGKSSFNLKSLIVLSLNYITIYSYRPLYFISIFGFILFTLGLSALLLSLIGIFKFTIIKVILITNSILFGLTVSFMGILSFYIRNIFLTIVQSNENRVDETI